MYFLILGIAMLFMGGQLTSALNSTSWAYCRVYPDPHFTTWHGDYFDYHGGCDLVLIKNSVLDFHIRTKNFTGWSGIEAAAIRIGGSKLEVQEPTGKVFVNNVDATAAPPAAVGGFPFAVVPGPPVKFVLTLPGGQYIELTRTYGNTLQVDVLGHGSSFGNSEGLCANWTANSPNALVARNGITVFPPVNPNNPYGEEWQVKPALGDPLLFQVNGSATCAYSQGGCKGGTAQTEECRKRQTEADNACANVPKDRNAQENCKFDILVTGDVGFAQTVAYTNPIIGDPPEKCKEVAVTATGTDQVNVTITSCSKRGGRCVWKCDKTKFECIDQLCTGPIEGCSCAIPISSTRAPTRKPTLAPVPVPTNTNTKPPTRKPTRAPVKDTRKPTRAPIKETKSPTRVPTKAPTRRCRWWWFLCWFSTGCSFWRRLLGLC